MNFYALPPILTAGVIAIAGVVVYLRNPTSRIHIRFALFCLSMFVWLFGFIGMYLSPDEANALWWARLGFAGITFIPVFEYHFILAFLGLKQRAVLAVLYLLAFVGLPLSRTPLVYNGIWQGFWGNYPSAGPLYIIFPLTFASTFTAGVWFLYRALRREVQSLRKQQIKYLLLAFACGTPGVIDYIVKFQIHIYPFGYVNALLFIGLIAYAIARYRLMDITVAMTRGAIFVVVYSLLVGTPLVSLLSFRSILAKGLGEMWWLLPVGAVGYALLASIAPLVFVFFQRKAEGRLLREQRRYQTMLLSSAKGMTQIHSLERLLKLLAYLLVRAMKLTHAGIFLWDEAREEYVLQVQVRRPCQAATPKASCEPHEPLVRWLKQERAPVVREEVGQLAEAKRGRPGALSRVESRLRLLEAAVVVPSFVNERLSGFLALGPKRAGTMYSDDDLNMLQTLANQAALAIENAQFYQKEREHQAELFHAASIADLGTMASSMSHQINNPLCIISGTAQTRQEHLRRLLRDNALPEAMRQVLQDEIASLQSITEESTKGTNIIATIRGITTSTEAARPLLVLEVVKAASPIAQHKVPFERLDFRRELPDSLPRIWGDKAQLAQCLIGFLENAWDAIQARQEDRHLPPPPLGYKGLIRLAGSTMTEPDPSTKQSIEWVVLTISDNGIGLKPEDVHKLFIPFFTTKATAEKAFGSLFVVRRIIEAHGGTVTAESTYGVGTTFKVKLPALTDEEAARRIAAGRVLGNGPVKPAK
jgi:signal transduction histidine kinase